MELTKEQIEFLDRVCGEWKLNSDGEVDVDGDVNMYDMNLKEIPVKFGRVEGDFNCYYNYLTTLKNCPDFVVGNFWCGDNILKEYFKNINEEDAININKDINKDNTAQQEAEAISYSIGILVNDIPEGEFELEIPPMKK
jgi:hypothetical protein